MAQKQCSVCLIAVTDKKLYEEILEARNSKKGISGAHKLVLTAAPKTTRWAVETHFGFRTEQTPCPDPLAHGIALGIAAAKMELTADGHGTIETGEIEGDKTPSWDDIIKTLGGDPETTQVKNSTIRVSAREVIKKDANGDPYTVVARSYSAALEPRDKTQELIQERVEQAVAEIRSGLRGGITPVASKPRTKGRNKAASFIIAWGDTQLGKSAGGGHEATVDRFIDCISRACDSYDERVSLGYRYNEVFMAIMGDLTEGVAGSYDSQLFTITLNKTDQDLLAIEVIAWAIEYVRSRTGIPLRVLFVNSNHGEHSRLSMTGGAKNKTSSSDTVDRMVASVLEMQYRDNKNVQFLIPGGNLVMTAKLNGVPCAFAHGHGIGARAKATTIQQELLVYDAELTEANGGAPFLPKLWVTAHYHHAQFTDLGPYLHVQTPALDGSSEWFTNISGRYSRPGLFVASVSSEFIEDGGVSRPEYIWVAKAPKTKRTDWHQKLIDTFNKYKDGYSE